MWEREEGAWTLHLRAELNFTSSAYEVGPFTVEVAWDANGNPAWVRVHDYPHSNAAERVGLDPGWAGTKACVEFRLRLRNPDLPDHVEIVPAQGLTDGGALVLGWQEDPFPRIGAVALIGSLVDLDALPGNLDPSSN